jgi:polyferredoxin
MIIDPTLQYQRRLRFMEKNASWETFKMVYWGFYVFVLGFILLMFNKTPPTPTISVYAFFGWALTLFALFYIIYGFSLSLHTKLMRKYG